MISDWQLQRAARIIKRGGVIAYPTEAVWGLGCNPWNQAAVLRTLALKRRCVSKGLIMVAASSEQFSSLLEHLPEDILASVLSSWPGPNTWLVPHRDQLPRWVTGRHATVALRVSSHPLVQQLCQLTGPLISTSANPAGRPAATSRLRIEQYFSGQLDAVLNAPLGGDNEPSCIRDALSGLVIRD